VFIKNNDEDSPLAHGDVGPRVRMSGAEENAKGRHESSSRCLPGPLR